MQPMSARMPKAKRSKNEFAARAQRLRRMKQDFADDYTDVVKDDTIWKTIEMRFYNIRVIIVVIVSLHALRKFFSFAAHYL